MCRDYNITKYKNNTHYTVNVTDSFGKEHTSFFQTRQECGEYVYEVWTNEVEQEVCLLDRAISNCVELDKRSGILKENSDGLD